MAQSKHTAGPGLVGDHWGPNPAGTSVWDANNGLIVDQDGTNRSKDEKRANANLIAEAFTVAHETGLTPRQLAEQRDELLAALVDLASLTEHMAALHPSRDLREVLPDPAGLALRIRAAIAKAEGGAA